MAEDDTLRRSDDEESTPPIVVPSHDPLPPPPVIEFTRPRLDRRAPVPRPGNYGTSPDPPPASGGGHGAGMAAGFTFVASILAGLLAGTWIDGRFNHTGTPWGVMVMTLAGAGVGFSNMFKLLSRGGKRKP